MATAKARPEYHLLNTDAKAKMESNGGNSGWRSSVSDHGRTLAFALVAIATLYFGREVLMPIALSILLTFLLSPLVSWLRARGLPHLLSVICVSLTALGVAVCIGGLVTLQLYDLAKSLPQYRENIQNKVEAVSSRSGLVEQITKTFEVRKAKKAMDAAKDPMPVEIRNPKPSSLQTLGAVSSTVFGPLTQAGVVIVMVVFMLAQKEDLRDRFVLLLGEGRLHVTTQALDEAGKKVSRYLLMQLVVNATYGIPVGIGLHLIGVPNALVWGLLATLLRFIPYVGPVIACTMPIALAIAVDPGWTMAAWTVGLFVTLELISNNVVEPWLYGSSTGVSSFAVIVAAVFWSWLWGPIGLFLSTPMTVCLAVIGRYVKRLRFLHILLADDPALNDEVRLYHRLLARKGDEAFDFVEAVMKKHSLAHVYSQVIAPALSLAEQDRHEGSLEEKTAHAVLELTKEVADGLAGATGCGLEPEHTEGSVTTLCIPSNDEADEICARMLGCLLRRNGVIATATSATLLVNEHIEKIRESNPSLICISALPPAALRQARLFCKRVRAEFPQIKIVLGVWTAAPDREELSRRLADAGVDQIVTDLNEAAQLIRSMVEAAMVEPVMDENSAPSLSEAIIQKLKAPA
ncbi:MAG TPA: AI-2E family transporter [Verrucomicrobiae bacterium]|nr:AI-2E family transporter [Verrucomicrobiae bacterium]